MSKTVSKISAFNLTSTNGGTATSASTLEAFKTTLHPVMTQSCGGCHGVNQLPLHSVNDAQSAMNTIVNGALVDFNNPAGSRVVQKIRGGHNAFPATLADQLQAQIVAWVAGANSSGGSGGLPQAEPLTPTFRSINSRIIGPKCASCHSGPNAAGGDDDPGEDDSPQGIRLDSYANVFSNRNDMVAEMSSGSMPPGPNDVTPAEVAVIRQWIQSGAPNN